MTPDFSTRARRAAVSARDVVALVVAAALLAWSLFAAWQARATVTRVQGSLREMRQRTVATEARLRELQQRRKGRADELAARAALTLAAPPGRVLAALEASLPAGVRLQSVILKYDETLTVELGAVARRPEDYDRFLERLEASRHFTELAFGSEARQDEMQATVRARYRNEGLP